MAVKTLELHRLADKSGTEAKRDGKPWPLADVALQSDPPKDMELSDDWLIRGMAEVAAGGPKWLELTNARPHPTSITVPKGPQAGATRSHTAMTGDEVVLNLADERRGKDGAKASGRTKVRYKVLEAPGYYLDDDEPSGYRLSHGYRVRLVSGKD